jgi:hypothetical protein
MALDQQCNWDIMMADNLAKVKLDFHARRDDANTPQPAPGASQESGADGGQENAVWLGEPIYLPDEIIFQVIEFLARGHQAQSSLAAVCLLSRQWYSAAIPYLYRCPELYGNNFEKFERSICPSKNLHNAIVASRRWSRCWI